MPDGGINKDRGDRQQVIYAAAAAERLVCFGARDLRLSPAYYTDMEVTLVRPKSVGFMAVRSFVPPLPWPKMVVWRPRVSRGLSWNSDAERYWNLEMQLMMQRNISVVYRMVLFRRC